MKIIEIKSKNEETARYLKFKCATCGKEKYARLSYDQAQSIRMVFNFGNTEILPYCETCKTPPEPDNLGNKEMVMFVIKKIISQKVAKSELAELQLMCEKEKYRLDSEKEDLQNLLSQLKADRETIDNIKQRMKGDTLRKMHFMIRQLDEALKELDKIEGGGNKV